MKLQDIFIGNFPITQVFDVNPQNYAQFGLKGHNGIDWGIPNGTQLIAGADGLIMETGNDLKGYGIYLKILHDGFLTIYAHLKELKVKRGDRVVTGQLVGLTDNTGNSTGPHLHFGVAPADSNGNKTEYNNGFSGYIDPRGSRVTWDIKNITTPVIPTVPPVAPPVTDRRDYWYDLIAASIGWTDGWEKQTDNRVKQWAAEYPSQRNRSGMWDKLCLKTGITGDSNAVTVDRLFNEIQSMAKPQDEQLEKCTLALTNALKTLTEAKTLIEDLKTTVEMLQKEKDVIVADTVNDCLAIVSNNYNDTVEKLEELKD